jgi:tRNA nucleotidyltransferase (CCA-adding enzyme)
VKPPRIWQELYLILNENKPKKYILRLNEICGLHFIHPRLKVGKDSLRVFDSIDRFLGQAKQSYLRSNDIEAWLMYLMALTEKLKLSDIKSLVEKFNLTKQEKNKIYSYKNINKSLFVFLEKRNLRPSQIYIVLKPLSCEALLLLRMKSKSNIAKKRINDFLNFYNKIRLSINGHDLNRLGAKLDENFKNILDKVFYGKLDGKIRSKEEEIFYAKELIAQL